MPMKRRMSTGAQTRVIIHSYLKRKGYAKISQLRQRCESELGKTLREDYILCSLVSGPYLVSCSDRVVYLDAD